MHLRNVIANFIQGIPLTLIAVIALVVVLSWLLGGVGDAARRRRVGVPFVVVLLGSWLLRLSRPPDEGREDWLFWATLALTALSFTLPVAWRRHVRA
jgi:hypothetical protein